MCQICREVIVGFNTCIPVIEKFLKVMTITDKLKKNIYITKFSRNTNHRWTVSGALMWSTTEFSFIRNIYNIKNEGENPTVYIHTENHGLTRLNSSKENNDFVILINIVNKLGKNFEKIALAKTFFKR